MNPEWSRVAVTFLLSAAAGGIIAFSPPGQALEESVDLGILFRLRGGIPPPDSVAVIGIDQGAARRLGLDSDPAAWPRSLHADLVELLNRHDVPVIAFDLFFEAPSGDADDTRFARAARTAGNVILSQRLVREGVLTDGSSPAGTLPQLERAIMPVPSISGAVLSSAPFPLPRIPIRLNRSWTFLRGSGDMPSFPAVVLQASLMEILPDFLGMIARSLPREPPISPAVPLLEGDPYRLNTLMREIRSRFVRHPELPGLLERQLDGIPQDRALRFRSLVTLYSGEEIVIRYYGPPGTVRTIPYDRALNSPGELQGKIVFVGVSESNPSVQRDVFHTVFSTGEGLDIAGIEVAATVVANLMEGGGIRQASPGVRLLIVIAGACALAGASAPTKPAATILVMLAVTGTYGLLAFHLFTAESVWIPIAPLLAGQLPIAAVTAFTMHFRQVSRERRAVRNAFSHYLPPDVVDRVTKEIETIKDQQQEVDAVCLYTDAERYTALSEMLQPSELARLMNDYFEVVFTPIRRHGGTISNIVGDSALAFWISSGDPDGARRKVCRAALEIADGIRQFNARAPEEMRLPIRIGIHAGRVILGNFGAAGHYEYRPVGDIVNTATRLEGLNKFLGTTILVSSEVLEGLEDLPVRYLGDFIFVGKKQPVSVHEPWREKDDGLNEALAEFRRGRFEAVVRLLAGRSDSGDPVARFYVSVCRELILDPPADGWAGAVRLRSK